MSELDSPNPAAGVATRRRSRPARRTVSPKVLWSAVALVAAAGLVAAVWFVTSDRIPDNGVQFQALPADADYGLAAVLPNKLKGPIGMTTDGTRLYVAESEGGVVVTLGPKGQELATVTVQPAPALSAYPSDIAVTEKDFGVIDQAGGGRALTMSDRGADPIELVDRGIVATGNDPTAIATDGESFYVADASSGLIKVFDRDGKMLRSFGESVEPRLGFVGGLTLSGRTMWMSDSNAGRVIGIDIDSGKQVKALNADMQLPRGVAVDEAGRVYVADEFGRVVRVFDADGEPLGEIGTKDTVGFKDGAKLEGPRDVAWLEGRLYVVDGPAGVIRVYNVRAP